MSKKKRVRRDIDKFYRTGRYWDLLRLLENEGLVSENPVEHRGAWKALIKQALQKEHAFEQFSKEVGTLRVLPNDPDFHFIMGLKGIIEGRGTPDEVMELKGLSPDADRLRSNLAAFGSSSANEEKLRALLEKFMGEPEKITRRYFEQLAGYLPEQSLRETVRRFGESIPTARRFNGKAAVARGWDGIDMGRLQSLDRRLQFYSQRMPGALVEILLHPFIHNVAVMCRRLAPEAVGNGASQLIRAIPFLLPRLAGERHAEIESKLLVHGAQWLEQGYGDLKALGRRLEGLSIEEKVSVLRGLRLGMQQRAPKGPDFDFPDYFEDVFSEDYDDDYEDEDDEDTDDEFEDWGGLKANAMARSLLLVHQSVLRDISTRFPELSHRDRKELVRVMEPILFQDMDYILNIVNSPDELVNLLDSTIRAGCGGTRTGLLSVVAGAHFRKVDLRKRAEELLDR
ncbi:MAG: hypothetical protein HGA84_03625, partial [Syntrophobacteraceae bacterium]|nr:hypothetical protein [Syntrophobacteraceae bacterium]